MLDINSDIGTFPHEIHNTETQKKCQNMCLCSQKYIWESDEKNITDFESWKKCDHCKGHHELYLNYTSENNSSSWVDIIEKYLEWNKQQNLDDENQRQPTTSNFNTCMRLATAVHHPENVAKRSMGIEEKSKSYSSGF